MKNRIILLFGVALVMIVVAVLALSENIMSPYVDFKEAKTRRGEFVQIIGMLDKSSPVRTSESAVVFTLREPEGESMVIRYSGTLPQNFDHADKIVALGEYDSDDSLFMAEKILVKCPSKYRRKVQ